MKEGKETDRSRGTNAGTVGFMNKTNWNKQSENTGINTQGIMGKMSDTWSGVATGTKTGETDQGVTPIAHGIT